MDKKRPHLLNGWMIVAIHFPCRTLSGAGFFHHRPFRLRALYSLCGDDAFGGRPVNKWYSTLLRNIDRSIHGHSPQFIVDAEKYVWIEANHTHCTHTRHTIIAINIHYAYNRLRSFSLPLDVRPAPNFASNWGNKAVDEKKKRRLIFSIPLYQV